MYTKIIVFTLLIIGLTNFNASAQEALDLELAEEYYSRQEYEKATELYDKLSNSNRNLPLIYKNYLKALFELKNFKEAEKLIKKINKQEPENPVYAIDYGYWWELQGKMDKAIKEYETVIDTYKKVNTTVIKATEHFLRIQQTDFALKMLLAGRKSDKNQAAFAIEIAQVYTLIGQTDKMIEEYLLYAIQSRSNSEQIKGLLQDRLTKAEEFEKLEQVLLTQLQKDSKEVTYNELLLWLYLQQKRFYRAFIQAKALDKRYRLEGSELFDIGLISMRNGDYKSAQTIFEYIIETYKGGEYYSQARSQYIKAKEEVIKSTYPLDLEGIRSLIVDYQNLIDEVGKNYRTFDDIRSMAQLYAFYLDEKDKAIQILEEAIQLGAGRNDFIAECKTDLGDIYLLKNEPWEATLLYSQVEKLKPEHPLGYEAKLRNAKLSYYKGEFELAQEHLDILKEATTREIANNAMELSLLIRDNLVFDTTGTALREFSQIELILFQHKDDEALKGLKNMLGDYPKHSIRDEVLWRKANLLLKMSKPEEALVDLEMIMNEYSEDIWGDDALFLMGKIYEEDLKNKDKAEEVYKNHLFKYPGSIYTAEVRKRFRILRGDFVDLR
jgi:tetratricopeptide (TPR) repeat protein